MNLLRMTLSGILHFLNHGRKSGSPSNLASVVGIPSVEAKNPLYQGLKFQPWAAKFFISMEDEERAKEQLDYDSIQRIHASHDENIGLMFNKGRYTGFVNGIPTLIENSGLLTAIVFESPDYYSLPARLNRLKRILVVFSNLILLS